MTSSIALWKRGGFVAILMLTVFSSALRAEDQPPPDWTPESAEALAHYAAGDQAAARNAAQRQLVAGRDAVVRRDAEALLAMILLHSGAREDRLDGRARLQQLVDEDPGLGERPECLLALGTGQLELGETAPALEALHAAAERFALQKRPARQAAALAKLAEAWARHSEWELTPLALMPQRPSSAESAERLRHERIAEIRTQLTGLPGADAALRRVDLLMLQQEIARGGAPADVESRLEALAEGPISETTAAAMLLLAELHEKAGQVDRAVLVYARLEAAHMGDLSLRAEKRRGELTRPHIQIECPERVRPGQEVEMRWEARNVSGVRVEVRQVNLADWLSAQQGRARDAQLPVAGALAHADAHSPTRFTPIAGSYVVYAFGRSSEGREISQKRLLIVSDLDLAVLRIGTELVLWLQKQDGSPAGAAEARFWMQGGTFVPATAAFSDGLGRMRVPPEALRLTDKSAACLVESGGQVAFWRGDVTPRDSASAARVSLTAGPPAPQVGETIYIAGLVSGVNLAEDGEALRVELRDVFDRVVAACPAQLVGGGAFSATFAVPESLAGNKGRIVVRHGRDVLVNERGRFMLDIPALDQSRLVVNLRMPPQLRQEAVFLGGELDVRTTWGAPAAGALARLAYRAVELRHGSGSRGAPPLSGSEELDERGILAPRLDLDVLQLSRDRLVLGAWVTVFDWRERPAGGSALSVTTADPAPIWFEPGPRATVGEKVHCVLQWADPQGLLDIARAEFAVRGPGGAELAAETLRDGTATFRPQSSGLHRVSVRVPRGGEFAEAAQEIEVAPGAGRIQSGELRARWEIAYGATVEIEPAPAQPRVATVTSGEHLIGMGLLPAGVARTALNLDKGAPRDGSTVTLWSFDEGIMVPVATAGLELTGRRDVQLRIETADLGESVEVTVRGADGDGRPVSELAFIARLLATPGSSRLDWMPRASGVAPVAADESASAMAWWCTAAKLRDGAATFTVIKPAIASRFRLEIEAVGAAGRVVEVLPEASPLVSMLDAPAYLGVGDTTVIGLAVRNEAKTAQPVRIWFDEPAGLVLSAQAGLLNGREVPSQDGVIATELPPGATIYCRISALAQAAGTAEVVAQVECGPEVTRTAQQCIIGAAPPPAEAAPVSVRRSILLLTHETRSSDVLREENPFDQTGGAAQTWVRWPLNPPYEVTLGDRILVREEVIVTEPLMEARWAQATPGLLQSWLPPPEERRMIGFPGPARRDRVDFQVGDLRPGTYVHEYWLVAMRPGECQLPPPRLSLRGREFSARMNATAPIRVRESAP